MRIRYVSVLHVTFALLLISLHMIEYTGELFLDTDFSQQVISSTLYEDCDFENCTFQKTEIVESIFRNCSFKGCVWGNVVFRESKLQALRFRESQIMGLHLHPGAVLECLLNIQDCRISYCVFEEMKLSKNRIASSRINDCSFYDCDLSEIDFSDSNFNASQFERNNLKGSDFRRAENYAINPINNQVKGAQFSMPAVLSLLRYFEIEIE